MSPRAAARRLAKLEGSLSPRASVLLWLAEAHAFPTLPAYARSLIDRLEADWSLAQIGERVEAAVWGARQGETRKAVEQAVREQIRDAFFLFELVVAINLETVESVDREGLRLGLLTYEMRCLEVEGEIPQYRDHPYAGRPLVERWRDWREAVSGFMSGLYGAQEARLLLEGRYLDGHACLFPELAGDWETLLQRAEGLAGVVQPAVGGRGPRATQRRGRRAKAPGVDLNALRVAARAKAPAGAAYLVDEARCATLDLLGDSKAAAAIVEQRLRGMDR